MDVIDRILDREGWPKFTNKANDRGGPTKGGITLTTLTKFLGRKATIDDLRGLSRDTARQLYELIFIVSPGFAHLTNDRVREYLIDIGVTSSPARATRYLQRVLGFTEDEVDGICGSRTLAAANSADPEWLMDNLIATRCVMIAGDVQSNPDQLDNLKGWVTRAVSPLIKEKTP